MEWVVIEYPLLYLKISTKWTEEPKARSELGTNGSAQVPHPIWTTQRRAVLKSQEELVLKMKKKAHRDNPRERNYIWVRKEVSQFSRPTIILKQTSRKAAHTGKAGSTRLVMIPNDECDNKHQKSCWPPNKYSFSHQHLQTILIHQTTELFFVEDIFTLFPEELKKYWRKNHGNC